MVSTLKNCYNNNTKNAPVEIDTFSGVLRSVDQWAAASICYKDVIHPNYCATEFPLKVGFKNKL